MQKEYFSNEHENDDTINIKQFGVTNQAEPDFRLDPETDTSITTLPSDSDIKLSGNFKPKKVGKYLLEAKFKYAEGEEVRAVAEITVIDAVLVPVIWEGLEKEVVAGSSHNVDLLVKNAGDFTATIVNIESGNLIPETIKIVLNRKTYTLKQFNDLPESEKKLNKGQQIKIMGTYKASDVEGPDSLGVKVNYRVDEGTQTVHSSFDTLEGGYTNVVSKESANVIVRGTVSPQAKKMKLNGEETIEFTFKNTSDKYPATGVEITIISTEPSQSEVKKN